MFCLQLLHGFKRNLHGTYKIKVKGPKFSHLLFIFTIRGKKWSGHTNQVSFFSVLLRNTTDNMMWPEYRLFCWDVMTNTIHPALDPSTCELLFRAKMVRCKKAQSETPSIWIQVFTSCLSVCDFPFAANKFSAKDQFLFLYWFLSL